MSETSKRADIVINFPKNGKVVNKDGSVAGYFVDAQYVQPMATGGRTGHIKVNPHLYTDWAHDKNNKAFMNHRQFLPLDVAKNVMKAARAKNAVMYKSKNYDEKLHYNFVDTSSAVKNMNNFKATTVLVNAGIDNILGDNRVLINKYDDFEPAHNLNGVNGKDVLAQQDNLTRLAQRKIGVGYSANQDKNLKTQRYDMMQLAHHLNKKYGVRDKNEKQPDTIIEISKSGDSPNSYNLKMFKTKELDENDFDYVSHTVKTQMPVTQNGMIKAPASMIAERNDMNTLETYNCLTDFYHNGEFNMDAGTAQTYFEPIANSLNLKFHPFPNKDSMEKDVQDMTKENERMKNPYYVDREDSYTKLQHGLGTPDKSNEKDDGLQF